MVSPRRYRNGFQFSFKLTQLKLSIYVHICVSIVQSETAHTISTLCDSCSSSGAFKCDAQAQIQILTPDYLLCINEKGYKVLQAALLAAASSSVRSALLYII